MTKKEKQIELAERLPTARSLPSRGTLSVVLVRTACDDAATWVWSARMTTKGSAKFW